jgi:hypothetical protein
MKWVTVFDIHQRSEAPGVALALCLAAVGAIALMVAASCFRRPSSHSDRVFGAVAAITGVVFLAFTASTFSDARQQTLAKGEFDAGRIATVNGSVVDMRRVRTVKSGGFPYLDTFEVGGRWFLSPLQPRCHVAIGDQARVTFLPDDGTRMTPLVLRVEMLHPCL